MPGGFLFAIFRATSSNLQPAPSHLYDVWYSLVLAGKSVFSRSGFYPFQWQDAVTHALSSPEINRLFWTCWHFRRRKIFRPWCSKFAPNKCRISVVWNFFSAIFHIILIFCILKAREGVGLKSWKAEKRLEDLRKIFGFLGGFCFLQRNGRTVG